MFDFGIYISVLITIIIGYISLSVPMRKERDYLSISNPISKISKNEVRKKLKIINLKIKKINILFFVLSAIVSFLYFFYDIKYICLDIIYSIFKKWNLETFFSNINDTLLNISVITVIIILYIPIYINIINPFFNCNDESHKKNTITREELLEDIFGNADDTNDIRNNDKR